MFALPDFETAALVDINGRTVLCCHRYGRLVLWSAGATLGASPVTSPIEKVWDAEVVIGAGFTALP
jgi:hypothetical protein